MNTSGPDGGELKRVDSYQWPAGHVGHLSEGQRAALERFKTLCAQKGYYHPGDAQTPASHDDETLLRYLRARKFIPQDGFGQFKDTEDWRQLNEIDKLYTSIDINDYERARRLYPQWTGRRDKRGIPFYVYEIAQLDAKDVTAYTNGKDRKKADNGPPVVSKVPRKMLDLFALYESLLRFVLPLCSVIPGRPNSETPVSQSTNIVDMKGVGLRQLWNLRAHMQDASKLATAHYPETLDRIFVVGAPSFFPTVWGWAKNWFDPITVSKIFILSDAKILPTLEQYVGIENIPKKYGGTLDWNFGEMPALGPDIADSLRWKKDIRQRGHRTFPIGPIRWQYDDDGDLIAIATGTENGKPRHEVIAGIHPESGVAKLALSPGRAEKSALFHAAAGAGTIAPASTAKQDAKPPTDSAGTAMAPESSLNTGSGTSPDSAVPDTSRAGTYTVPFREEDASAKTSPFPDGVRQGTSDTRFEQQAGTHADGQMEHGTPNTRKDGQGTEHAVMEPRTVGQAPKETPLYREDDSKPTMIEQAQHMAGQAYEQAAAIPGAVISAVGLGGKKEPVKEEPKQDERIDGMEDKNVEEFIRARTMSRPDGDKQ